MWEKKKNQTAKFSLQHFMINNYAHPLGERANGTVVGGGVATLSADRIVGRREKQVEELGQEI